jgi:hypothetical protein
MVPVLSSAARIPLPEATMAFFHCNQHSPETEIDVSQKINHCTYKYNSKRYANTKRTSHTAIRASSALSSGVRVDMVLVVVMVRQECVVSGLERSEEAAVKE